MTRNETIERIGAGLRREIGTIVQAPLSPRMRELLAKLERMDPRPTQTSDRAQLRAG
jgi:hypothetical protein